jgi:hypothetical protein
MLPPSYCRRKATTFLDLLRLSPFLVDNLFLNCACKSCSAISALEAPKGKSMQNGSMRTERHGGPDVGNSGGENLDLMADVNFAEWSLVQRMSSTTRLRLAKRLRAFIFA